MEKYKIVLEEVGEMNSEAIKVIGYDDCIIGACETFEGVRLLYSEKKIIKRLMENMTEEEAIEYFEFNILGAHISSYNPVFLMDYNN